MNELMKFYDNISEFSDWNSMIIWMNLVNEILWHYEWIDGMKFYNNIPPIMNAVNGTCNTTERWKLCLMQLRISQVGSLKIKNTTSGTISCGFRWGAGQVRIRPS